MTDLIAIGVTVTGAYMKFMSWTIHGTLVNSVRFATSNESTDGSAL